MINGLISALLEQWVFFKHFWLHCPDKYDKYVLVKVAETADEHRVNRGTE